MIMKIIITKTKQTTLRVIYILNRMKGLNHDHAIKDNKEYTIDGCFGCYNKDYCVKFFYDEKCMTGEKPLYYDWLSFSIKCVEKVYMDDFEIIDLDEFLDEQKKFDAEYVLEQL